jgi:hypothetical protein
MKINGDYARQGYAHIVELIPPEVADAFLRQVRADLPDITRQFLTHAPIIRKTSIDVYATIIRPCCSSCGGSRRACAG